MNHSHYDRSFLPSPSHPSCARAKASSQRQCDASGRLSTDIEVLSCSSAKSGDVGIHVVVPQDPDIIREALNISAHRHEIFGFLPAIEVAKDSGLFFTSWIIGCCFEGLRRQFGWESTSEVLNIAVLEVLLVEAPVGKQGGLSRPPRSFEGNGLCSRSNSITLRSLSGRGFPLS